MFHIRAKIYGVIECNICGEKREFEVNAESSRPQLEIDYANAKPEVMDWQITERVGGIGIIVKCPKCQ